MMKQHIQGKIIKGIGGFYYVLVNDRRESVDSLLCYQKYIADGEKIVIEAKVRGSFRYQKIKPAVGDWVEVLLSDKGAVIEKIAERKNHFIRPPVANVDLALIVMAVKDPSPHLMLLDKLLIAAEYYQTEPIILLTKNDLISQEEKTFVQSIYTAAGYPVFLLWDDEKDQFRNVKKMLTGKTAFLAGPSGVGKSTFANRLCQSAEMATGDLSRKLGRGRHTTRHVALLEVEKDTYLLDTPGFSSFELPDDFSAEDLGWYFREFPQGKCRFNTCTHRHEPGCAVRRALSEGSIAPSRYENYCRLYEHCLERNKK